MAELNMGAALSRIEQHLSTLAIEGPKNAASLAVVTSEIASIKTKVVELKNIVTGEDGGNGLRLEVRDLTCRIEQIDATIAKMLEDEIKRNTLMADWGWKVVTALAAAFFALPALIAQLRDLVK